MLLVFWKNTDTAIIACIRVVENKKPTKHFATNNRGGIKMIYGM